MLHVCRDAESQVQEAERRLHVMQTWCKRFAGSKTTSLVGCPRKGNPCQDAAYSAALATLCNRNCQQQVAGCLTWVLCS